MRTLLFASLLGLAACSTPTTDHNTQTAAGAEGARDCFLTSTVSGYNVVDDHTVRVIVGANRRYLLGTNWNARDLSWTVAIALKSGSSDWICVGNGLGVEVRGGRPLRSYPITSVTREPQAPPAPQGS